MEASFMSDKFIRFAEVERRTGFCRAWIYHLIAQGEFPRPIKTGNVPYLLLKERLMPGLRVKSITQTRISNTITEIALLLNYKNITDIS